MIMPVTESFENCMLCITNMKVIQVDEKHMYAT